MQAGKGSKVSFVAEAQKDDASKKKKEEEKRKEGVDLCTSDRRLRCMPRQGMTGRVQVR